jgi:ribonuclease E
MSINRILINASSHNKEVRVALVNGQTLNNLDIETTGKIQKKANVYKGKITRVEPSLEAAFVDYGEERHGFLPLKEISSTYFTTPVEDGVKPKIAEVLKEGTEVIVQVEKEERGNKGAALTTFITVAGSYLVLMPNTPKAGGVSRRIDGDDRNELCDLLRKLKTPEKMGIIIRTASVGKSIEELQWDLDNLLKLWEAINTLAEEKPAPFLIHQESNIIIRAIRDYLRNDVDEVLIDNPKILEEAKRYVTLICPDFIDRIKSYEDVTPLFSRFQIELQAESVFQREVRLPSGGSVVIDLTEALISIDINSARATKGSDIEETAFRTNLEACDEIARQLRLRDIGGLIVIDFIDMQVNSNQREVEDRLKNAVRPDRARIQIGRISRFGLLEMSRQRLRSSLTEASVLTCPLCNGQGAIRSIESLALSVARSIEENALKANTAQIRVYMAVDLATYLLNEKRRIISDIEARHNISVLILPNNHIKSNGFEIERLRQADMPTSAARLQTSYMIAESQRQSADKVPDELNLETQKAPPQEPALKSIVVASKPENIKKKPGLLARLLSAIFKPKKKKQPKQHRSHHQNRGRSHHHQGQRRQHGSGGNRRRYNSGNRPRNDNRSSGGNRRRQPGQQNRNEHTQSKKTESRTVKSDD